MEQEQILELLKSKGFTDTDDLTKVFAALDAKTADLNTYKTKASAVTELEAELKTLKDAQTARDDAEKTELEKLQGKIAKMEGEAAAFKAEALKATRSALLERGIAEQLGTVHENLRGFAADYLRTVLPSQEWADAEALKATITASIVKFGEKLPEEMRVVASGETPPPRTQDGPAPAGEGPIFDANAAFHGQ